MSRTPNKPAAPTPLPAILPAVAGRMEATQEQATARQKAVNALAVTLNYNGSTDPSVLENSAKDAIRRIGMSTFELGAYLLLLKEACEKGKFLPALERLGVDPRFAQRYMAVTRRFANTTSMSHLERVGLTKMIELVVLDDEQLEDLTELGQTGELALDDVARMSVKELRAKVRELRSDKEADQQVLTAKNKAIDRLQRDLARIEKLPPDKDLIDLKQKATGIATEAEALVLGGLRQALIAINNHAGEPGQYGVFMAGLVGQVQAQLNALRQEFNLPDVSEAEFDAEARQAVRAGLAQMRAKSAAGAAK